MHPLPGTAAAATCAASRVPPFSAATRHNTTWATTKNNSVTPTAQRRDRLPSPKAAAQAMVAGTNTAAA